MNHAQPEQNSRIAPFTRSVSAAPGIAVAISFVILTGRNAWAGASGSVDTTQISVDDLLGTVFTYGPAIGGMYVLYAIASSLLARYRSSSWMAHGKRLAITTGVLGVVGAGLQVAIAGAPWAVALAAAVAAAFKLITPTVTKNPLALGTRGIATAGATTTAALVALVALVAIDSASCGGAQSRAADGTRAALECEAPNIRNAVDQLLPAFIRLVTTAILGDGTLDRDALTAAVQPFRDTALQCTMDAAVAALAARAEAAVAASAGSATGTAPDPRRSATPLGLRSQWSQIRGELGWAPPARP